MGELMGIRLRGNTTEEMYCEVTDVLDEYLLEGYKKHDWMQSYLCPYDEETLLIRVPGATRGNIKLEGNKIKQFTLYEDTAFSTALGCYDKSKKKELIDKLNEFIGKEFG